NMLMAWWLAEWARIPGAKYYDPILLMAEGWLVNLVLLAVLLPVGLLLGALFVRSIRQDGALFAACAGLGMIAIRGGEIQYALRAGNGSSAYLLFGLETILLFALVWGVWRLQRVLVDRELIIHDVVRDGLTDQRVPLAMHPVATLTHAATMCVLLLILCRSQDKAQTLAAVGLASFGGALAAHSLFPIRQSIWLVIAPGLAALVG